MGWVGESGRWDARKVARHNLSSKQHFSSRDENSSQPSAKKCWIGHSLAPLASQSADQDSRQGKVCMHSLSRDK